MRLRGWNDMPAGYGARFDVASVPTWLRVLYHVPFLDRFAYPLLVRRGLGFLIAHPGWPPDALGEVADGWRLQDPDYVAPGSISSLRRRPE